MAHAPTHHPTASLGLRPSTATKGVRVRIAPTLTRATEGATGTPEVWAERAENSWGTQLERSWGSTWWHTGAFLQHHQLLGLPWATDAVQRRAQKLLLWGWALRHLPRNAARARRWPEDGISGWRVCRGWSGSWLRNVLRTPSDNVNFK